MAQKLNSVTPDIKPPDIANPDGSYLDKTEFVVGSPTLAGIANSFYSFFSALMVFTGTAYSGQVDTTTVSQYFNALGAFVNTKVTAITDPLSLLVAQNANDIDTNESAITANSNNIQTNANNISNNDNDISTLGVRIDDNDVDINNNSNAIGSNASNINDNANAINTLENKTPQSYQPSDQVEFAAIDTGQGFNAVVPEDDYFNDETIFSATAKILPLLNVKQTGHKAFHQVTNAAQIRLPSPGVYSYIFIENNGESGSSASSASSSLLLTSSIGNDIMISYRRIS